MLEKRILWAAAGVLALVVVAMAAGAYIGVELWCVVHSCNVEVAEWQRGR